MRSSLVSGQCNFSFIELFVGWNNLWKERTEWPYFSFFLGWVLNRKERWPCNYVSCVPVHVNSYQSWIHLSLEPTSYLSLICKVRRRGHLDFYLGLSILTFYTSTLIGSIYITICQVIEKLRIMKEEWNCLVFLVSGHVTPLLAGLGIYCRTGAGWILVVNKETS